MGEVTLIEGARYLTVIEPPVEVESATVTTQTSATVLEVVLAPTVIVMSDRAVTVIGQGAGPQGAVGPKGDPGELTAEGHGELRSLAHLSEAGPFWLSGAIRETLPANDPFPTLIVWWADATKTKRVFTKLLTLNSNKQPLTIQWTAYADDGVTVVAQAIDTITYSSIFETSRTRTVVN